jgi:hypothetical protein
MQLFDLPPELLHTILILAVPGNLRYQPWIYPNDDPNYNDFQKQTIVSKAFRSLWLETFFDSYTHVIDFDHTRHGDNRRRGAAD